jgi:4-amino-4-deoxy-L-arabinose transferase-like glycosyltransferase
LTRAHSFILILFGAVLLFSGLGLRTLTQHEIFAAQPAKEMLDDNQWIIPHFAGKPRVTKPPTTGWLIAAMMKITHNRSEWVARFPAACAGVVSAWLIAYFTAKCVKSSLTGLVAGLIQLTSYFTILQARLAEADMLVCASVTLAMISLAMGTLPEIADKNRKWSWGFYIGASLAFLFKGVPIAFVALSAIAWLFLANDRRPLIRLLNHGPGLVLLAIALLGWPVAAIVVYPPIVSTWISEIFGTSVGIYRHDPIYFYLLSIPMVLLPWFPFAIVGLFTHKPLNSPLIRFLAAWFVPGVLLLHFGAQKSNHYPIPMLPPFSLLAAVGLMANIRKNQEKPLLNRNLGAILWCAGLIACAIAAFYISKAQPFLIEILAILIFLWTAGLCAIYYEQHKNTPKQLAGIFAGAMAVALILLVFIIPRHFNDFKPIKDFATVVNDKIPPTATLRVIDPEEKVDPPVVYYLNNPVKRYANVEEFINDPKTPGQPIWIITSIELAGKIHDIGNLMPIFSTKSPKPQLNLVLLQLQP